MISDWLSNNWIEIFGAITGIIYVFLEIRQNIWLWPVGIVTSAVYIIVFFTSKFYADMSLQVYYLVISFVGWYWWIRGGRRQAADGRRKEMEKAEVSWLPSQESLPRLGGGLGVSSDGSGLSAQDSEQNFPLEGGRALKNDPVDHFSEGVRLQGERDVKLKVTPLKLKTGLILSVIFILLYFLMWFVLSRLTDSPVPGWDSFITSLSIIATWMLARKIYEHWYLWMIVNSASVILFLTRGLYPTVILYLVYLAMSFVGRKEWKRHL